MNADKDYNENNGSLIRIKDEERYNPVETYVQPKISLDHSVSTGLHSLDI